MDTLSQEKAQLEFVYRRDQRPFTAQRYRLWVEARWPCTMWGLGSVDCTLRKEEAISGSTRYGCDERIVSIQSSVLELR